MKSLRLTFNLFLLCLSFSSAAKASDCFTLYDDKEYEAALPFCLKEKDNFRLGYIYSTLNECQKMKHHYLLANSPTANGNLGYALLNGKRGCKKNINEGIKLLKDAILGGNKGFATNLGDYYKKNNNPKLAKSNYLKAIEFTTSLSDWQKDRARNAFYGLSEMINTDEKINLIMNSSLIREIKCKIGENLYQKEFQTLIVKLKNSKRKEKFIGKLCEEQQAYFIGLTFENGLGNKEDFREAYRLYLIAGAKGNISAKAARDRIRDKLLPEQVAQATCLADYGLTPNMFNRWRCGW